MSDKQTAKIGKLLRQKAQEFLASRRNANHLIEILRHLESGADTIACLQTLEIIFTYVLQDGIMYNEVIPLKPPPNTLENQYKEWLRKHYDDAWSKILDCFNHIQPKIQLQALTTAMKLLEYEGRFPLESRSNLQHYLPINRIRAILMKIIVNTQTTVSHLIEKYHEYCTYDDVLFFTWKSLPTVTAKCNPSELYIANYLKLLEKLKVQKNTETLLLCCDNNFNFEEHVTAKCLNKVWNCVMQWQHNAATHKQMLVILLERVMPYLEKPLLMTDFLMDSLDVGGSTSFLALQGILTMLQLYNLDYPNIYAKLYSMFEPEIFHTKFKARLFYLADMFLSSTHLPENIVAAFVKRLSRLALVAPSQDIVIICVFIGNLMLRHPGLKCMLHHSEGITQNDPYIMEECDPVKSNAISSSLWELKSLQYHVQPHVAEAARFINDPLPSIEWDLSKYLDDSFDDAFDKAIKKNWQLIATAFERPNEFNLNRNGVVMQYWDY